MFAPLSNRFVTSQRKSWTLRQRTVPCRATRRTPSQAVSSTSSSAPAKARQGENR